MSRHTETSIGDRELGALVEDIRVRVVNCSATGCLLESDKRLDEGTIATLDLTLGGHPFSDVLKVVRCEPVAQRPGVYHVGARFLSIAPAYPESIRHIMRHDQGELAEWLNHDDAN
jgi:PilZ domain